MECETEMLLHRALPLKGKECWGKYCTRECQETVSSSVVHFTIRLERMERVLGAYITANRSSFAFVSGYSCRHGSFCEEIAASIAVWYTPTHVQVQYQEKKNRIEVFCGWPTADPRVVYTSKKIFLRLQADWHSKEDVDFAVLTTDFYFCALCKY